MSEPKDSEKISPQAHQSADKPVVGFLIAGVQKSGTTALNHFLKMHEDIFLPARKELHFFDNENIDNWHAVDYSQYELHFIAKNKNQIAGETTPIYLYWPDAIQRIFAYNPNMKLIICLRNPVNRAYSHWKMEFVKKKDTLPFSEAIRAGPMRGAGDGKFKDGCHRVYSYVGRGLYAPQLENLFSVFPRSQIHIATHDELTADYERFLDIICDFLDVSRFKSYPENKIIVPPNSTGDFPEMSRSDYDYLKSIFREDLLKTSELTGLDLTGWL